MDDLLFTLGMTIANTLFWVGVHFGVAALVTFFHPGMFAWEKGIFPVRDGEMAFYRKVGLPHWKDALPQYNRDYDKRHLHGDGKGYLLSFINATCRAEVIHLMVIPLGFLSLLFSLCCSEGYFWLFLAIACLMALGNLPFALVQRYNRYRLVRLMGRKYGKSN